MTSVDEQQLALAAAVGQTSGPSDQRVAKLQGAVQRLNGVATNLRAIASDIDWSGPSAQAARDAFAALAGAINEHADAVNAIAAADRATDEPLSTAYHDYQTVLSIDTEPGHSYPGSGMMSNEEYRALQAREARQALDTAMIAARGRLVSAAAWDLDPPAPTPSGDGGTTGTIPDGVPTTSAPGTVDPTGPVVGTVPPGSGPGPTPSGGVDPVGPVGGTVPYGSSDGNGGAGATNGGFDPVGPVTGTTEPNGGGNRLAELRSRLG